MKLVWSKGQWKWAFYENVKKAPKSLSVKEEHFDAEFTCNIDGVSPDKFRIYGIKPRGRKWTIWARRSLDGGEYKFSKEVLNYIGKEAPIDLCGGQEYLKII